MYDINNGIKYIFLTSKGLLDPKEKKNKVYIYNIYFLYKNLYIYENKRREWRRVFCIKC